MFRAPTWRMWAYFSNTYVVEQMQQHLHALRAAVEAGKIKELRGFGLKAEIQLKEALAAYEAAGGPAPRVVLSRPRGDRGGACRAARAPGEQTASRWRARCAAAPTRSRTSTSSPPRSDPKALAAALAELELVESVQSSGEAGARVSTHSGMKIDLKVVEPDQFGNVLQYFTGSKAHRRAA